MNDTPCITEPGFYILPDDEYFADPVCGGSVSNSDLKAFLQGSPAAYKWRLDNPPAASNGMSLGTYVHAMAMNQTIDVAVYEGKALTWTAKDSKEFRAAALADGKVPLLASEKDTGDRIVQAILGHRLAHELIQGRDGEVVQYEHVAIARDDATGMMLRGKIDIMAATVLGQWRLADIKTTSEPITPESLSKVIGKYSYHQQAAFYTNLVAELVDIDFHKVAFDFIFVSSVEPHEVAVVRLPHKALDLGETTFRNGLAMLKTCHETDTWPGFENRLTLDVPRWLYR